MVAIFRHIISSDVMLNATRPYSCVLNAEQIDYANFTGDKKSETLA